MTALLFSALVLTPRLQDQDNIDERSAKIQATRMTASTKARANVGESIAYQLDLETRSDRKAVAKRSIEFKLDGTAQPDLTTNRNGIAKGNVSFSTPGSHQISFSFLGDKKFGRSSARKTISVYQTAKVDVRVVSVSSVKQSDGVSTLVNIKVLVSQNGSPLSGVKVAANRPGKPPFSGPSSTSSKDGTLFLSAGLLGHGSETWQVVAFGDNTQAFTTYTSTPVPASVTW